MEGKDLITRERNKHEGIHPEAHNRRKHHQGRALTINQPFLSRQRPSLNIAAPPHAPPRHIHRLNKYRTILSWVGKEGRDRGGWQ